MTDWRQIQARIRKAKSSPDALTKLSELFQRTRDGMVAWELGGIEEKSERTEEAAKWYAVAAERFRRAEWKKKAEEALARLGVDVRATFTDTTTETRAEASEGHAAEVGPLEPEQAADSPLPHREARLEPEGVEVVSAQPGSIAPPRLSDPNLGAGLTRKKRRRGRRGGRGRRRELPGAPSLPTQDFSESLDTQADRPELRRPLPFRQPEPRTPSAERPSGAEPRAAEPVRHAPAEMPAIPQLPSERTAHGRAGDPALASRMAQLESVLRRLLSSPLHRLDEAEQAPAGPGVFLLSDSDQVTSYYVEACQTLRVGLANLLRGGRAKSDRSGRSYPERDLKRRLAEHLEINESKVAQYMKDHCVVRWIQLDDDAAHLAHFAIGVLRTALNLE